MTPPFKLHDAYRPGQESILNPPNASPLLLVSVRDRPEFETALAARVGIIDWKEPHRGPLAAADVDLWNYAANHQGRRIDQERRPALSAALGESSEALSVAADLPAEFDFAKVGPSGCDTVARLSQVWEGVRRLLCDRTELVAVAYADWKNANCLEPEAVFQAATDAGFRGCLVDTYTKDGRSTLDHLGFNRLRRLHEVAQEAGLWWALAGSINLQVATKILQQDWTPDCFAVRGDVCSGERTGVLCQDRIERWRDLLTSHSAP